jgi:hypothetical protein
MKPRVVIQRVSDGQYRKGSYSWTENLDLARVFRSDGIAKNHRSYEQTPVRYVPVKLTVIE